MHAAAQAQDALIGRDRPLHLLLAYLRRGVTRGSLCVWGPPGIGKSALLRTAAAIVPTSVCLVDVGAPIADELVRRVRLAWQAHQGTIGAGETREQLPGDPSPVLALDGLERWPIALAREAIEKLRARGFAPSVAYTSYAPLGLPEETSIVLGPLTEAEARALYQARGGLDIETTGETFPLPLRPHDRTPFVVELLAAASHRREPLPRVATNEPRDALDALLSALDPSARALLEQLAIAPDTMPLEALVAPSTTITTLATFGDLCERRLATIADGEASVPGPVRAAVLATMSDEARAIAETAHAAWLADLVAALPVGHGGIDGVAAFTQVRKRRAHLVVACERHRASPLPGQGDRAAALALALDSLLIFDDDGDRHIAFLEAVAERAESAAPKAELAFRLARVAISRGMSGVALRLLAETETVDQPSPALSSRRQAFRAHAHMQRGEGAVALASAESAAASAREVRDPGERDRLLAFAHQELALAHTLVGSRREAGEHYDLAIDLARKRGATRMLALLLTNTASLLETTAAERLERLRESRALFEALGDQRHCVYLGLVLARLAPDEARDGLLATSARDAAAVDDFATHACSLLELAARSIDRGDEPRARRFLDEARIPLASTDDFEPHARARALEAALGGSAEPRRLRVRRDGTRAILDTRVIELESRRALPLLLAALARDALSPHPAGLDVSDLFAVGWPGERASVGSLSARVHMGIRTLRTLGLADVLITRQGRYRIAEGVRVEWLEPA